jgi:hypothetical protein
MSNNSRTSAYQTSVADLHDRVSQTLLTRHHARRKRYVFADHGSFADLYVPLIENSCKWKQNYRPCTKLTE